MASFDKYTNYKNNVGVSNVVFGSDRPVLEVEMNEMQEIQKQALRKFLKTTYGDLAVNIENYCEAVSNNNFVLKPCVILVDGYLLENTQTFSIVVGDTTGKTVPVYLHVWEEVVDSTVANLNVDGNYSVNTTPTPLLTTPNYMKDSRLPSETSCRKVVKFKITTVHDGSANVKEVLLANVIDGGVETPIKVPFNYNLFVTMVENNFLDANNRIASINTLIGTESISASTIRGTLSAHEVKLTDLTNKFNTHGTNLSTLNTKVGNTTLTTTAKDLSGAINEHESDLIAINNKVGNISGIASLDSTGKVPASQLPSYVDDVIEGYFYNSAFYKESAHTNVITGETGKVYVDIAVTPPESYRYSGSAYVKISNVGDSKANTVSFVEATALENINTNETHATLFGKIKKFFNMIGTTVLNTTNKTVTGAINELLSTITPINTKVGSDNLTTTATNLSSAINEHETDISGVNTKLGNSTLTTTAKNVTGAINELDSDMSGISTKIGSSTLNTSAQNLSGAINEHEIDMTNLNTKVGSATLNTTAKDLSGAVNEHETDVTNLNNKMGSSTLTTTAQTVTEAIVEHESDLVALNNKIGATSGIASLDSTGKVPIAQLPSYVDDVMEGYYYNNAFYKELAHTNLITAETGKIYVDISVTPPESYRYSGSAYVKISNVGDSKGNTVSFTEESVLANILTGETHATLFGKIKKFFSMIGTTALTTTNKTVTGAINEHETDISGINSSVSDLKSAVGSDYIVSYTTPPSYSGRVTTVYAGTKYICAEGRDANGNVKQVVRTLTSDVTSSISATTDIILFLTGNLTLMAVESNKYGGVVRFVSDLPKIVPDSGTYIYYVVNEHCYYRTVGSTTANWYVETYCKIAYVRAEFSYIKYLKPNLQQNLSQKIGKDKLLMTMAEVNDNTDKEFVPSAVAVKDISQVTTSGWNPLLKDYETFLWTTQTVSAPNFEVKTIDVLLGSYIDLSYYLSVGMKIRLVQGGVTKYFFIVKIAGDIITLYGGTDYVLTNAAITDIYYSMVKAPHGFPLNPNKWTVISTAYTQETLTTAGRFNSAALSIPIGLWDITLDCSVRFISGNIDIGGKVYLADVNKVMFSALSQAFSFANNYKLGTGMAHGAFVTFTVQEEILSAKTIYICAQALAVATDITLLNDYTPACIKATCAYL